MDYPQSNLMAHHYIHNAYYHIWLFKIIPSSNKILSKTFRASEKFIMFHIRNTFLAIGTNVKILLQIFTIRTEPISSRLFTKFDTFHVESSMTVVTAQNLASIYTNQYREFSINYQRRLSNRQRYLIRLPLHILRPEDQACRFLSSLCEIKSISLYFLLAWALASLLLRPFLFSLAFPFDSLTSLIPQSPPGHLRGLSNKKRYFG